MATVWTNLLVGRKPSPEVNRPALEKFLRNSFARNQSGKRSSPNSSPPKVAATKTAPRISGCPSEQPGGPRHGDHGAVVPRRASAMHAVPSPSVRQWQAEPNSGSSTGSSSRASHETQARRPKTGRVSRDAGTVSLRPADRRITKDATASMKVVYPKYAGTKIYPKPGSQSPAGTGPADVRGRRAATRRGVREPHLATVFRLRFHPPDRRHGTAQSADPSGTALPNWSRNSATAAMTSSNCRGGSVSRSRISSAASSTTRTRIDDPGARRIRHSSAGSIRSR